MTGYFSPDAAQDAAQGSFAPVSRGAARRRIGPGAVSLLALLWAAPALAQTTINSDTTKPLVTSTAGDVTINQGGTIKPPSGVAVTIDSNNSVTNTGVIEFQNLNNVTAILAHGGVTGSINNNATLEGDATSTTTTDSNGIIHGPFANGTNRFGIQVVGPGVFNGDVD